MRALVFLIMMLTAGVAGAVHDGISPGSESDFGIVRINTTDGDGLGIGACSAAVIVASQSRNESWLMTAAHCFYGASWRFQQIRRPEPLGVSLPDHGVASVSSTVFVHPSWANDSDPTWYDNLDIALVRIASYVPVQDDNGDDIAEFRRPIYVGGRDYLHDLPPDNGFLDRGAYCGYGGTGTLLCGLAENLEEDDGYVVVDGAQWIGGTGAGRLWSKFRGGDSGGPFFVWNANLCSGGERPSASDNQAVATAMARHGVIVGVVSGPDAKNAWDAEVDSYATGTFGLRDWLDATVGPDILFTVDPNACDAGMAVSEIRGTGGVVRSQFGSARNHELVAPREGRRLVHFYRDNAKESKPWYRTTAFGVLENFDNLALIQSSYGNLELVVRNGDEIRHYWRRGTSDDWQGGTRITRNARGAPGFTQSSFGTVGDFQVVFPREGGRGLVHLHRQNDVPGLPWRRVAFFGEQFGRVDAVSLIQSSYGNLEIVFRDGDRLFHMWRHNQNSWQVDGTTRLPTEVRGVPSIAQQPGDNHGDFEVLVPSAIAGVSHIYRDNSDAQEPWIHTTTFATDLGSVDGVTLTISDSGELEAFVFEDNRMFSYRRESDGTWVGPLNP